MQTTWAGERIAIGEPAAGDDREIERVEIPGARGLEVGQRAIVRSHRRIADDLGAKASDLAGRAVGETRGPSDLANARDRADIT